VKECYILTKKAFEISEAFQTPVIVLLDFFLSNRFEDVQSAEFNNDTFGEYKAAIAEPSDEPYLRFKITESGISPRAYPGMDGFFHAITGLEHDEKGFPNYEADNHLNMTEKRYRKLELLVRTWPAPECIGDEGELDIGIISWGSTIGAAKEAIIELQKKGLKTGGFFPRLLWPLHPDIFKDFSNRCKHLAVCEMNHTGQFANIVDQMTNRATHRVSRVYAEPMPTDDIINELTEVLQ